jgi:peptide/nickel transport system substrate-binding protein
VPGESLVLERNRHYAGPRPQRIDRVVLGVGDEVEQDVRDVDEGRADVLGAEVPFEFRDALARRYGVNERRLFRVRGQVIYFLALNTSRPLFRGNVALRKAVNVALDRGAIVRRGPGWPLSHRPTDQILPRSLPGWVDHRIYPLAGRDLRLARRLAARNLRSGKAVLYAPRIPFLVDHANVVARQLSDIGLEVDVTLLAPAAIDARAGRPGEPYDIVLARYFPEYPDPANVIGRLLAGENARRPTGNTNLSYFDTRLYNRRIAAAERLRGARRLRAFARLDEDIIRNAAPVAPLYDGSRWFFFSDRVGCVRPDRKSVV